uniref:Uncharacterized protein n=1 Tax=Anguilla anguilla TaxID=7936 RepID=A0A0E9V4P0_ANGAN
MNSASCFH